MNLTAPQLTSEYQRLEAFFARHSAGPNLELSTLADFRLLELFTESGYVPFEWNHVLWRRLRPGDWLPPPRIDVRLCNDAEEWARTVAQGFFERDGADLTEAELDIGRHLFGAAGARCYTAFVEGEPAGGAAMFLHEGLALFHAAGTIPRFRGRGIQSALVRRRLIDAVAAGAWLATGATAPGSISQRNYERHGFAVLYARLGLLRE